MRVSLPTRDAGGLRRRRGLRLIGPITIVVALVMNTAPAGAAGNANLFLTKTVSGATLLPNLSLTLGVDKTTAIPGDTLTYAATITNTGSTVTLTGDFTARNTPATAMQVASYYDDFATSTNDVCAPAITHGHNTAGWTPLAGTAGTQSAYTPVDSAPLATGMTLALTPVAANGVTYPTSGDPILGTQLQPGATAEWHYTATMLLTPSQVSFLLDPTKVTEMRNTFHVEVTPRVQSGNGQPDTVNNIFCQLVGLSGSVTSMTVTITPPEGTAAVVFTKSTTPGLASIATGQSVTVITSHVVNTVVAKANTETDAAYLMRLATINWGKLQATAVATGTGASGTVSAPPPPPVITAEQLPIVTITKSGPATVDAGTTETNPLSLQNSGGAAASGLTITDSVPDGTTGAVSGTPTTLSPAGTGSASAAFSVPGSQPNGNLTDTAAVMWQDANGNSYGPVSSTFTTQVQSSLAGATLTLSPASAGPDVTGTSQALTATLLDRNHMPIANQTVTFTVTGANPTSAGLVTDVRGSASFTYTGTKDGSDQVQAMVTSGSLTLDSNTVTVGWVTPIQTVSTSSVTGRFYFGGCGGFCADVSQQPVFTQSFPTIDFDPPSGTIPGNITGVGVLTRPFTDITTNPAGDFTGATVAQGNGHQAGSGDLFTFDAVFTGNYVVATAGDLTFNFYSDDGFILGVGGGATRVGGSLVNPPPASELEGYPVMGAYNVPTAPVANSITVHFPAAGTYPYEVDYSECCGGALALTMANAATGIGVPPAGNLAITPVNVPTQTVGQQVNLTVAAMDASGQPIANLPVVTNVGGTNTQQVSATTDAHGLAVIPYIGTNGGTDFVIANASVSGMPAVSNIVDITWAFGSGSSQAQPPPIITAPSPADGAVVTKPVPISATFAPPVGQTIASWNVSYQELDALPPVTLASGTGTPPSPMATFDPTMLPNDSYAITTSATASGGGTQSLTTTVAVFGNLKLGRYVTSFQDLSVPVNGFQMEVRRTYDSIDKHVGDFGVGWHISVSNFRVSANRTLGAGGWTEYTTSCFILCNWAFRTSTPHFVTVSFPDQHEEVFDFTPDGPGLTLIDFAQGTAHFTAKAGTGTTSTLEVADAADQGFSYGFDGNLYGASAIYNPTRFKLTTHNGRILILDTALGLVSETDPSGNSLRVDSTGIHASNGESVTFARDSLARVTTITDPNSQQYKYTYSSAGDLASFTDPVGNVITYSYDANHDLLSSSGGGHALSTLQYDSAGRLTAVTNADGNTTQISDNVAGQQQTITDPAGKLSTVDTFDDLGDLIREDQVFGSQTLTSSFTYDAVGRQLTATDPLGHVTTYTYDTLGDLLTAMDPLGHVSAYTYDSNGHLLTATAPDGTVVTTITYDSSGLPTRLRQADGSAYTLAYDSSGQPVTITDPNGGVTIRSYDSNGYLASSTDPLGNITAYGHDADGRITAITDPAGHTTANTYDATGNLIAVTDATGATQRNTYDLLDHLLQATDALGHTTQYTYDSAERLTGVKDPTGGTTSLEYDADGRLISTTLADGSARVYGYDELGRLTAASDLASSLAFTYNAHSNLITQTSSGSGQPTVTLTYGYDADGNETSVAGPTGTTRYGYDMNSRLSSVTDPSGGVFALGYNSVSELSQLQRPNGVTDAFTYDPVGNLLSRVSRLNASTLASSAYSYTADGQRSSLTNGSGTTDYAFSQTGMLLTVGPHAGSATESYTYDVRGNRTSDGESVNAANELLANGQTTYTYDNAGNVLTATTVSGHATTSYKWNSLDQLTGITFPDGTTEGFAYDALGRRVQVSSAGQVTNYVNDGPNPALIYTGATLQQSYVDGLGVDNTLEETSGSATVYPLQDGLNSTVALTNSAGAIVGSYTYSVFGQQTHTGSATSAFTYTGREGDAKSGLYYYRARYQDPTTGRFLSVDPLARLNPYTYVQNDPVDYLDPSGAQTFVENAILRVQIAAASALARVGLALASAASAIARVFGAAEEAGPEAPAVGEGENAASAAEAGTNGFDIAEGNAGHIFRNAPGHLAEDTAANRQLLQETANDPANYVSTDSNGVATYRQTLPDGTQSWAEVYNGQLTNGGVNNVPR